MIKPKILVNAFYLGKNNGMNSALREVIQSFVKYSDQFEFKFVVLSKYKEYLPPEFQDDVWVVPNWMPFPIIEQVVIPLVCVLWQFNVNYSPYNTFPVVHIGFRVVVTVHDVIFLNAAANRLLNWRQKLTGIYRSMVVRPFLRGVDLVITDSKYSKGQIISLTGVNGALVKVIPLSVDETVFKHWSFERFQKFNLTGKKFFLHLGAVDPRKNSKLVLDAYVQFSQNHPDVHLVVTGNVIREVVSVLDTIPNAHYYPMVDQSGLISLYNNAVALLFPSELEGFGLPILEAFASQCPVVTFRGTSIPEVAMDAAYYITELNVGTLAVAMETLCTSEVLRNKMVLRGNEVLKSFSSKRLVENYVAELNSLT